MWSPEVIGPFFGNLKELGIQSIELSEVSYDDLISTVDKILSGKVYTRDNRWSFVIERDKVIEIHGVSIDKVSEI